MIRSIFKKTLSPDSNVNEINENLHGILRIDKEAIEIDRESGKTKEIKRRMMKRRLELLPKKCVIQSAQP